MIALIKIAFQLLADAVRFSIRLFRPTRSVQAENLFLRRQFALFKERGIRPRRVDSATRSSLAILARFFDWRDALFVVRPNTMIRWHRAGWRLFWRWKCRPDRRQIPAELRVLIRRMARENPVWGEERIASEWLVKLGIQVSPRTVRKYMAKRLDGQPRGDQRWSTFLKNHANAILACDFFVAVTAACRLLYVFVVIKHGSRRLARVDVTAHPSADWTLQQLREVIGFDDTHRYLIHDWDSIFARQLDESIKALGVKVLKSPPHCPKANAICERLIGTIRRECLDWLIPISESHLRSILTSWVEYYNRGRPHSSWVLGSRIRRTYWRRTGNRNPAIDWGRALLCSRNRCWVDCIMSIRWRRGSPDRGRRYQLNLTRREQLRSTGRRTPKSVALRHRKSNFNTLLTREIRRG